VFGAELDQADVPGGIGPFGNSGNFATIIDTMDDSQVKIEATADKALNNCHDLRNLIDKVADAVL